MKRDKILRVIQTLAFSQGSYGRLYSFLTSETDEAEQAMEELEDQNFSDEVDLVMFFEM